MHTQPSKLKLACNARVNWKIELQRSKVFPNHRMIIAELVKVSFFRLTHDIHINVEYMSVKPKKKGSERAVSDKRDDQNNYFHQQHVITSISNRARMKYYEALVAVWQSLDIVRARNKKWSVCTLPTRKPRHVVGVWQKHTKERRRKNYESELR